VPRDDSAADNELAQNAAAFSAFPPANRAPRRVVVGDSRAAVAFARVAITASTSDAANGRSPANEEEGENARLVSHENMPVPPASSSSSSLSQSASHQGPAKYRDLRHATVTAAMAWKWGWRPQGRAMPARVAAMLSYAGRASRLRRPCAVVASRRAVARAAIRARSRGESPVGSLACAGSPGDGTGGYHRRITGFGGSGMSSAAVSSVENSSCSSPDEE
jgi:hypothetical protein